MHVPEREPGDIQRLEDLIAAERKAKQRDRCQMALWAIRGQKKKDIARQLGVYAKRVQSGRHEAPGRMATHGCKLVRHMLWNCAKVAARFNPDCKALFERLRNKGKHAASCYGAVARKLVQLVFGVLKHRQPFTSSVLTA